MKMQRVYILVLVISILLVVFAIQNADAVELHIITYTFSISLSLLVILSVALGTILSFLFSLNEFIRYKNEIKKKDKEIARLKENQEELHETGSTLTI
jgi:uncharacterized integral membrane protein